MFRTRFFSPFSSFNDEKIKSQVLQSANHTTCDHGNVQSHDQEESKLNSNINVNSGAHDKIIKRPIQ